MPFPHRRLQHRACHHRTHLALAGNGWARSISRSPGRSSPPAEHDPRRTREKRLGETDAKNPPKGKRKPCESLTRPTRARYSWPPVEFEMPIRQIFEDNRALITDQSEQLQRMCEDGKSTIDSSKVRPHLRPSASNPCLIARTLRPDEPTIGSSAFLLGFSVGCRSRYPEGMFMCPAAAVNPI
jgi:hypothetical protein